jgi:hypothetical protein
MQVYSRDGIGLVLVPGSSDVSGSGATFTRIGLANTLDLSHFDDCEIREIFLS